MGGLAARRRGATLSPRRSRAHLDLVDRKTRHMGSWGHDRCVAGRSNMAVLTPATILVPKTIK